MVGLMDRTYLRRFPGSVPLRLMSYALFEGRPITTRGRAINPLIRRVVRLAACLPKPVTAPIYIAGLGRSGTTALSRVLSVHPQAAVLNEPKLIWNLIHPGEDVIGNYSRLSARYVLDSRDATTVAKRRATRLFGGYLRWARRSRLIDKYPEVVFRTGFIRSIFPDALFVCLIRNANDTIASIADWSRRFGRSASPGRHDWWGIDDRKWKLLARDILAPDPFFEPVHPLLRTLDRHEDRAALEWAAATRAALLAAERHPRHTFLLSYERWVRNPRFQTERILGWSGLGHHEATLDYAKATLSISAARPSPKLRPEITPLVEHVNEQLTTQGVQSCE